MNATPELLSALEERWRSCGAPISRHLRAGISDDEMDVITLPLGLSLSPEARTWWRWHDGVSVANEATRAVSNGFAFLPLAEASQICAVERWKARAAVAAGERRGYREMDPESIWPRTWFPMLAIKFAYIVCDVSVDPSPVFYWSREEFEVAGAPEAPSIGAMVQMWIEAIDQGYSRLDPTARHWTHPEGPRTRSRIV